MTLFQPAYETHPAVVVFIVLSGYCIHRNGLRTGNLEIVPYFIRHAFRIVPIFVLASVLGALSAWFLLADPTISLGKLALKLTGISAFVPTLNRATYQGNGPLHTVMVEIWLYAIYPVVILYLARGGRERNIWVALAAVWLAGVLVCGRHPALTNWWHNGSLFGFLLYWWIGAWFVCGRLSRSTLSLVAVVWTVLSVLLITTSFSDLMIVELRKLCFCVLVGAAIAGLDRPASLPVGRLGQAGYSLYAFHAPVVLALLAFSAPWWLAMVGALAVGFIAFLTIEQPFTLRGKAVARARSAASLRGLPLGA